MKALIKTVLISITLAATACGKAPVAQSADANEQVLGCDLASGNCNF